LKKLPIENRQSEIDNPTAVRTRVRLLNNAPAVLRVITLGIDIDDCRWTIADWWQSKIGNRKSTIGGKHAQP